VSTGHLFQLLCGCVSWRVAAIDGCVVHTHVAGPVQGVGGARERHNQVPILLRDPVPARKITAEVSKECENAQQLLRVMAALLRFAIAANCRPLGGHSHLAPVSSLVSRWQLSLESQKVIGLEAVCVADDLGAALHSPLVNIKGESTGGRHQEARQTPRGTINK
jgi:hypothetical protein